MQEGREGAPPGGRGRGGGGAGRGVCRDVRWGEGRGVSTVVTFSWQGGAKRDSDLLNIFVLSIVSFFFGFVFVAFCVCVLVLSFSFLFFVCYFYFICVLMRSVFRCFIFRICYLLRLFF